MSHTRKSASTSQEKFSNNFVWKLESTTTCFEVGVKGSIPKKVLTNSGKGIQIGASPYRIILEPCIPCDNYCRIDIEFADGIPSQLMEALQAHNKELDKGWHEKTANKLSCLFEIGEKGLDTYMAAIEDFFISRRYTNLASMMDGCNALRAFLQLPARQLTFASNSLFSQSSGSELEDYPLTPLQVSWSQGFGQ